VPSSTIWQAPTIDLGSSTAPLGSLSSLASAAAGVAKAHAVARSDYANQSVLQASRDWPQRGASRDDQIDDSWSTVRVSQRSIPRLPVPPPASMYAAGTSMREETTTELAE
jgi:hypothetical protein